MAEEKRIVFVGVRVTNKENEALRRVAFRERTTKSSLLRQLFVEKYLERGTRTEKRA